MKVSRLAAKLGQAGLNASENCYLSFDTYMCDTLLITFTSALLLEKQRVCGGILQALGRDPLCTGSPLASRRP